MSVSYDGGDFLRDYYQMPEVLEDKGEKEYFDRIYGAIHSDGAERMFLVRGYLELLIGKIIGRAGKHEKQIEREVVGGAEVRTEQMDQRIQRVVDFMVLHIRLY